ncbi:hypothetical protein DX029_003721 [Escherichia coli]|jgi:cell division ATPase FtsA|uniref:Uncharacterized protein n=2 Tax=Enterobacteriaceae TaxID=543 RepID=A0AAJ2YCJ1_ECOLX|nr:MULTISPECIES: hypothetical protein [Escherichia]EAU0156834.1 hypothetical protein [Salmonella enterica]EBZ7085002.1 hypothetical protein [Salmonella enterica subsp. enterica serovar Montevideo]ECB1585767.1 hypothetical protein [Salmonella enterica subsp. enterica serovar Stanleyville]ECC8338281.1 hypothetical protein [Salmonella enterica subsp. enterica serovar Ruiru]HDR9912101.1 hypothetical protein [Escherichia coli 92.0144 (F03)]
MSNYLEVKRKIGQYACVTRWGFPCAEREITLIQNDINSAIQSGKVISRSMLQGIISRHVPNTHFLITDSVDNSDLNTALRMLAPKQK